MRSVPARVALAAYFFSAGVKIPFTVSPALAAVSTTVDPSALILAQPAKVSTNIAAPAIFEKALKFIVIHPF